MDVATPHYHQYRKYLSQNAVQELVEPSREGVDTVSRWLEGSGIPTTDVQVAGAWIYFTTTILRASDLMQTQFDLYRRDDSRASRVGTLSYSVPLEVQPHVDLIYPTIQFSNVGAQISRFHNVQVLGPVGEGFNVSDCNTTMTPACIRALYNIHDAVNGADKPTGFMGVAGFLEQTARFADYDTFKQEYDSSSSNGSFDIAQVEGRPAFLLSRSVKAGWKR